MAPARQPGPGVPRPVFGILGFFLVTFIAALICGFIARAQISGTRQGGNGRAIAGIVLGFGWLATYMLAIIGAAIGDGDIGSLGRLP